jgi:phosphotransacetylase
MSGFEARKNDLADFILIGDEKRIESLLDGMGESSANYTIIAADDVDDAIRIAVSLTQTGEADVLMKGRLETGHIMKALVSKENNLKKGGLISLVGFYETTAYHKLFAVSDMGINTYPELAGKKDILLNALEVLHSLGIDHPKIAVLAAVEKVNPKMQDTVDAAELKNMNQSGEIGACTVEGPISFDLATSKKAADIKGFAGEVAGDADLLLVPDIVCGNVLVKCLTGFAGATTAGLVVGAKVPVVLTSRSAEASDKYYSIALAAYAAQNHN